MQVPLNPHAYHHMPSLPCAMLRSSLPLYSQTTPPSSLHFAFIPSISHDTLSHSLTAIPLTISCHLATTIASHPATKWTQPSCRPPMKSLTSQPSESARPSPHPSSGPMPSLHMPELPAMSGTVPVHGHPIHPLAPMLTPVSAPNARARTAHVTTAASQSAPVTSQSAVKHVSTAPAPAASARSALRH